MSVLETLYGFLRWFFSALGWFLAGILWSITIIGLPVGKQCLQICGPGGMALRQGEIVLRRRRRLADSEYHPG